MSFCNFRGWGIRCLDDICHGGFICIYAGQMLTEQGANQVCLGISEGLSPENVHVNLVCFIFY